MDRAVERGLEYRESQIVSHICVDETSFRKGHKYITVVSDATSGKVLYVGIGRTKKVLKHWYMGLPLPRTVGGDPDREHGHVACAHLCDLGLCARCRE